MKHAALDRECTQPQRSSRTPAPSSENELWVRIKAPRPIDGRGQAMVGRVLYVMLEHYMGTKEVEVIVSGRMPPEPEHPYEQNTIKDIAAERWRQIQKGYDADHDDKHDASKLSWVASDILRCNYDQWGIVKKWSGNRRRQLVIAAALVAAQIDRLDRAIARTR